MSNLFVVLSPPPLTLSSLVLSECHHIKQNCGPYHFPLTSTLDDPDLSLKKNTCTPEVPTHKNPPPIPFPLPFGGGGGGGGGGRGRGGGRGVGVWRGDGGRGGGRGVGKGILRLTWLGGGQGWVVGGRRNGSI